MGWLDTREGRRKQHLQMIATGNIRDIDRMHERDRKRRWFIFLDIALVICILIGIAFIYYNQDYITGIVFIVVGLLILLYLIFRKKRRHQNFQRRNQRHYHKPRHYRNNRRR